MQIFQDIKNIGLRAVSSGIIVFEIIEINRGEEKTNYYNIVALKKTKKEVQIIHKRSFTDIATAVSFIEKETDPKVPVIMVFNGQKIISRTIYAKSGNDDQELIKSILPDIEPEKLIINRFTFEDDLNFVSIARRSYTESLQEVLLPLSKRIIGYSIGPSIIFSTYRIFRKQDQAGIRFLNYSFRLEDNQLKDFEILPAIDAEAVTRRYELDNAQLEEIFIIPYCTGLKFLLHPYYAVSELVPANGEDHELFVFHKLNRLLLISTLLLLLLLNIISNLYTSNQTSRKKKIASAIAVNEEELKSENALFNNKQRELNATRDLNISEHSTTAFYTDQIVKTIPRNVYITRMIIHPFRNDSPEDPEFDQHIITITGNCYASKDLAVWVDSLKYYEWVKTVTLNQFGNPAENNNKLTGYTITIIKK